MYLIILLESILIVFWIDIEYDTSDSKSTTFSIISNNQKYSTTHGALDIVGNNILIFDNISEKKKISLWLESPLKHEMLSYSPNIQLMEDFFLDRVEDNGKFKTAYLNYMKEKHDEYIGTLITKEEFEEKISNPSSFRILDY